MSKQFLLVLALLFIYGCQSNDTKKETYLLEKRVLEKRILAKKLEENHLKQNKTYSKPANKGNNQDVNGTNIFTIKVENDGFFDIEIPKYTVIIKRTADLNGEYVNDTERTKTHTSGFFGSDTYWDDAEYGYYTVEYFGFDKYDKKVFHKKFSKVLHKCHTVGTFYTKTDWNSPNVYCF